ncbi:MAG: sensor histidine kinase, partial [Chloroflexota bacterium]
LINNAIKYTPPNGQIRCDLQILPDDLDSEMEWAGQTELPPGRWAALYFIDNGIGISQHDLPYLFERFYQVKNQGNTRGTGLGLAIARELVALHAGQIRVASTLGAGSIFAVYLPLEENL